jgi:hypothetical protein
MGIKRGICIEISILQLGSADIAARSQTAALRSILAANDYPHFSIHPFCWTKVENRTLRGETELPTTIKHMLAALNMLM